jgi:hypothetical protein
VTVCLAASGACTARNPSFLPSGDGAGLDARDAFSDRVAVADGPAQIDQAVGVNDASSDRVAMADGAPAPAQVDLLTGLIGYWRMDEPPGSSVARDSSGLHHDGTLENIIVTGAWVTGHFGSALQISDDDKNAGVRVALTPRIAGITRYTVAAWARRTRLRPTAYQSIISRQLDTGIAELFDMSVSKDLLQIYGSDRTDVGVTAAVSSEVAPVNEWFHAAASFDGQMLRIYQNGTLKGMVALAKPLPPTDTPLYLGTNKNESGLSTAHHPWEGQLDEILLYDVVLSPASIAALASGTRPAVP